MNDDTQLLRQYSQDGSDQAFRELVERHIQLVNSAALRMVAGDTHLAQDVTQIVFTDLARKAATLPGDVLLGGWLYRHTCFTASKAIRTESRRRVRERTAMELRALNENTGQEAHWLKLAPVLDEALNHLGEQDRNAIVLRYLQRQDLRSVGLALGTTEDTAQKRVSRALDKLRGFLTSRGIVLSSALLATTLDASISFPVPHGLAATVSASAVSTAAQSTGFTLASFHSMITSKTVLVAATSIAAVSFAAVLILPHSQLPTPAPLTAPAATPLTRPVANAPVKIAQMPIVTVPTSPAAVVEPTQPPAPAPDPGTTFASVASPADNVDPFSDPSEPTPVAGLALVRSGVLILNGTGSTGNVYTGGTVISAGSLDTSGSVLTFTSSDGTSALPEAINAEDATNAGVTTTTISVAIPDGTPQSGGTIITGPDNSSATLTITRPDGSTMEFQRASATVTAP